MEKIKILIKDKEREVKTTCPQCGKNVSLFLEEEGKEKQCECGFLFKWALGKEKMPGEIFNELAPYGSEEGELVIALASIKGKESIALSCPKCGEIFLREFINFPIIGKCWHCGFKIEIYKA